MPLKLLAFAHATQALGFRECEVLCTPGESPRQLLARLFPHYDPAQARIALDLEYIDWDQPIETGCELAIIPPVSGG